MQGWRALGVASGRHASRQTARGVSYVHDGQESMRHARVMYVRQGHSVLSVSSPPLSPRPLDIDVGATLVVALLVVALGRHKACPYDVGTAPGVGPEN